MTSELTINVQPDSIQIAITEDHNLVEYQKDAQEVTFAVGNLYLGRVKKLMPGLNACFVDLSLRPSPRHSSKATASKQKIFSWLFIC